MAKKKKSDNLEKNGIILRSGSSVNGYYDTTVDDLTILITLDQKIVTPNQQYEQGVYAIITLSRFIIEDNTMNINIPLEIVESQNSVETPIYSLLEFNPTNVLSGDATISENVGRYYHNTRTKSYSRCIRLGDCIEANPNDYVRNVNLTPYNTNEYNNILNDRHVDVEINRIIYHDHVRVLIDYKPSQNFTLARGETKIIYFYNSLLQTDDITCKIEADYTDTEKDLCQILLSHDDIVKLTEGSYKDYFKLSFNANTIDAILQQNDFQVLWAGDTYKLYIYNDIGYSVGEMTMNYIGGTTSSTTKTTTKKPSIYDINAGGGTVTINCYELSSTGKHVYGAGSLTVKDSNGISITPILPASWDQGLEVEAGGQAKFKTTSIQDGTTITVTYIGMYGNIATKKYTQEPSQSQPEDDPDVPTPDTPEKTYSILFNINLKSLVVAPKNGSRFNSGLTFTYDIKDGNTSLLNSPMSSTVIMTYNHDLNNAYCYEEDDNNITANYEYTSTTPKIDKVFKVVYTIGASSYYINILLKSDNLVENQINSFDSGVDLNETEDYGFVIHGELGDNTVVFHQLFYDTYSGSEVIEYFQDNNQWPYQLKINDINTNITLCHHVFSDSNIENSEYATIKRLN